MEGKRQRNSEYVQETMPQYLKRRRAEPIAWNQHFNIQVPEDIWSIVLSFVNILRTLRDISSCSSVCRSWRKMIWSQLVSLDLRLQKRYYPRMTAMLARLCENLSTLYISTSLSRSDIVNILRLKKIRDLHFGKEINFTYSLLKEFLSSEKISQLQNVTLWIPIDFSFNLDHRFEVFGLFNRFSSLKCLNIKGCELNLVLPQIMEALASLPFLTSISISSQEPITMKYISAWPANLRNLELLADVDVESIVQVGTLTQLEQLTMLPWKDFSVNRFPIPVRFIEIGQLFEPVKGSFCDFCESYSSIDQNCTGCMTTLMACEDCAEENLKCFKCKELFCECCINVLYKKGREINYCFDCSFVN